MRGWLLVVLRTCEPAIVLRFIFGGSGTCARFFLDLLGASEGGATEEHKGPLA